MKVKAIEYGDRRVYSVAWFNRGVAEWLARLPTVWVEGEVTELRRQDRWQSVFLTLKDPEEGACLAVTMPRGQFDALRLDLANGERVHVYGRPELFEARGDFRLRALSIERFGLGDHLAALERLKQKLAAEGLFDTDRKRPLPRLPRRIGLVTGNERREKDVLAAITARFPPARLLVAETYVQGPRAATAIADALRAISETPEIDVVVLARGGGASRTSSRSATSGSCARSPLARFRSSPRSDTSRTLRSPISSPMRGPRPPLPPARLLVPDLAELTARLERSRAALATGARRALDRERRRLDLSRDHLRRAPLLLVERRRAAVCALARTDPSLSPRATLDRGYAIVRTANSIVRAGSEVTTGTRVDVELGTGGFEATVEDTH